tara:strand:- start:898 stop:2358 length:1461 start_codon:yes stop_codon:yes gene_type:complete
MFLSIDIGTSSIKSALFNKDAEIVGDSLNSILHEQSFTKSGGVEEDPKKLFNSTLESISRLNTYVLEHKYKVLSVSITSIVSTLVGLDSKYDPITPVYLYSDTRNKEYVDRLTDENENDRYQRTGVKNHTSYQPSRLLWLRENHDQYHKVKYWVDFPVYLMCKLFAPKIPLTSFSLASWSGLFNLYTNNWDKQTLLKSKISEETLPHIASTKINFSNLTEPYNQQFPSFDKIPWFMPIADGFAATIGSNCIIDKDATITVGSTTSMRFITEKSNITFPDGLWKYKCYENTFIMGGSLTEGGNNLLWLSKIFHLDFNNDKKITKLIKNYVPGNHGLSVLPFISGERAPGWNPRATGSIFGINFSTNKYDILISTLESICYRLMYVKNKINEINKDYDFIISGGVIDLIPDYAQMLSDVLGTKIIIKDLKEATLKGGAILSLRTLGFWESFNDKESKTIKILKPNLNKNKQHKKLFNKHDNFYNKTIV